MYFTVVMSVYLLYIGTVCFLYVLCLLHVIDVIQKYHAQIKQRKQYTYISRPANYLV